MARYGNLDAVKLKVQRYLIPNTDDDGTVRVEDAERWFLKLLDEEPTADVAPKNEVARAIFGAVKKAIKEEVIYYCNGFEEAETLEMQNYFKNKQDASTLLYMKIDSLERKYTEARNERFH